MNRAAIVTVATLLALAGAAHAQDRKPLPPPPAPSGHMVATERLGNLDAFLAAYRRAGSPRLLIATDVAPYAGKGGLAGETAHSMGEMLGARLEDLFRDPEVIVINAEAQGLLGEQQREALRGNDEHAAARILARDAGADMVLTVTLAEKPQCGRFSATYVISDLRQGTTLGRYAFDVLPDPVNGQFDNYRLSEYARAIARRMSTQFIEAFPGGGDSGALRRWTLRIVGDYSEDDLDLLRDALNAGEGVRQGSVTVRGEERSSGTLVTTMDMLSSQDLLGVRRTLRYAVDEALIMGTEVLDAKGQTVTLRLRPLGLSERDRALAGGPLTPANQAARETLLAAYEKAGRPTIGVMVNRARSQNTSAGESSVTTDSASPLQHGDGTNIIIGDRVGAGSDYDAVAHDIIRDELADRRSDRVEQREVDIAGIENRLVERLSGLGLHLKDVAPAQATARAAGELDGTSWTDKELAAVLGEKAGADVVLSGVARVTRTRPGQFPLRVELTVRAFRVSDGVILGAATAAREVASAGATLDQALDSLSAEATGRLAGQLNDSWAK